MINLDPRDEKIEQRGGPAKKLMDMEPQPSKSSRNVKIGACIDLKTSRELVGLLRGYVYIFGWSHKDMPGIDLAVIVH